MQKFDNRKRIGYIDFLKFIALTGIIIAHVDSPNWMMMFRSFDVPCMVILSAFLAERSYQKYETKNFSTISKYYISRIKRLVIPTWIFLCFYFFILIVFFKERYSIKIYVFSFFLTRYGIGYVWIILIYLYGALLVPLFDKIGLSIKSIFLLSVVYFVYEIVYYFKVGVQYKFIDTTFYYIIPYGFLTYLGYNYRRMKIFTKYFIFIISGCLFLALAFFYYIKCGSFQRVDITKYPPRLYYLCYGICCSVGLLLLCEKNNLKIYNNSIVKFISIHSMWIYLWHILVLKFYDIFGFWKIWYIKLFFVYVVSIVIVLLVNKCLDIIERKKKFMFVKYLRG